MPDRSNGQWLIVIAFIVALWLSIIPLPLWAHAGRPEFVALVLIYWVIALPERVGISLAWVIGLFSDIIEGCPLGENALALSVVAYLSMILYQRVRMFTPFQQAAVIFVLIGVNQLISHWVQTLTGKTSPSVLFLLPALVSALLWPALTVFLQRLGRTYYVH